MTTASASRVWCLALYEHENAIVMERAHEIFSLLLSKYGLTAGRCTIKTSTQDKSRHPSWRALSGIAKLPEHQAMDHLTLERRRPEAPNFEAEYHQFDISNDSRTSVFSLAYGVARDGLADAVDIAEYVIPILRPRYGYVAQLTSTQSAILYSAGIPYNPISMNERQRELAFQDVFNARHIDMDAYRRAINYKLRDLYPVSFLSETHLLSDVGGGPLKNWIRDFRVGVLTEIEGTGLTLWKLPDDKLHVARDKLHSAGLLIT